MKALVLTADLGGNVPPTLAIAEALAQRGVEVVVAGLTESRTSLPHADFTFSDAAAAARGLGKARPMSHLMLSRKSTDATTALVDKHRPDVVLVDCMLPAPLRGALDTGVPVVTLFHTFGSYWVDAFDAGPAGRFFGLFGLRPRTLWNRARSRLLLTDRALDPASGDPRLAGFAWTGTTEHGAAPAPRGPRPRVLVALTSTDWPGMLPVYRRIVSALRALPVDAIVTTGGVELGGVLEGASNVDVRAWVPHSDLLPSTDLVVGHGGHSTTMKALAHGIPLLVLPVNPTADQRMIGELLQRAGLGRWLPKSASADRIRGAVEELLGDPVLRERAAATGRRLRAAPAGAEVAADAVMAAVGPAA